LIDTLNSADTNRGGVRRNCVPASGMALSITFPLIP
jgi:hypothetical protein